MTLALVACGDDSTTGSGGSTVGAGASGGTTVTTVTTGAGAGGNGAGGTGASGTTGGQGGIVNGGAGGSSHGGGHAGGAGGTGGIAQGGGNAGGAGGVGGLSMGGMGGAGGDGGAGGQPDIPVHGCTRANATDKTSMSTVDLTWVNPLGQLDKCIRVRTNTLVRWNGDFNFHPLEGGISPTSDAGSIITQASPSGGTTNITFASTGTFPFFCGIHTLTMQGVVYVE
jgi:hypothetical protein